MTWCRGKLGLPSRATLKYSRRGGTGDAMIKITTDDGKMTATLGCVEKLLTNSKAFNNV